MTTIEEKSGETADISGSVPEALSAPGGALASTENARHRHNRRSILSFEFMWGLGLPFVQYTTTLPGYLNALGAPGWVVGLVPAIFLGGIALIGPFSVYLLRSGPGRPRRTVGAYRLGILCYLVMGASALLLPAEAMPLRLAVFFTCYLGYVCIAGAGDPHYIAMIVSSTTEQERGRFFGMRQLCCGIGGLIGGSFVGMALAALPTPHNFGLAILIGSGLVMLATTRLARFREGAEPEVGKRAPLGTLLLDVWRLAARRPQFRVFLVATCLFVLAQAPFAFLALFIKERLGAADAILGRLSLTFMACSLLFSLLVGFTGDRFGHRSAFSLGLSLYAMGMAGALAATTEPAFLVAYFAAAAFSPTWGVSSFNLGFQCSGEADPARIYAGIGLAVAPLRIIGPVAAGAAVDRWGYGPVLIAAALLAGAALLLVLFLLPRKGYRKAG